MPLRLAVEPSYTYVWQKAWGKTGVFLKGEEAVSFPFVPSYVHVHKPG